ncbi:hypothetical protein ACB092_03G124000 [Castanea dentata]
MEVHQIKRCLVQMILLAGPGVLISTFCLGVALKFTFPYEWSWKTSLLLGGLLGATDPVAVVALLKELGASKKLSTIIEGESVMNDGNSGLSVILSNGPWTELWLGCHHQISHTSLAWGAQEVIGVSGVLTVMTLGMEMVAYIANTLIFILSGVVIAEGILSGDNIFQNGYSWAYLILLYVYVQVSRFIVVGVLYPFLKYFGYGLDWKEATILIWSGLRGAVALALSLSVKQSSDSLPEISSKTGTLFLFFTGGIVFLTLIVNGSTTQFILHLLNMDTLSTAKWRKLDYTKHEMLNKALEAFRDLGEDEELGPVGWSTVKIYITCLNNLEEESVHPHSTPEDNNNLDVMNLEDLRKCLLKGVQAAYWGMLVEGRITQNTAKILMQSVDEALDLVSDEPLCDWKGLKANVHFPSYYKLLQTRIIPQKLVMYFTVERLEFQCYICSAFLRAHRIARRQLHDFIGDNDIASTVVNESEVEGEEAKMFLEEVRVTFPQVLRVVKTRQVTYSKIGLLEEKEMLHLHDAVQTDLKKLLRNPPLVKIPKIIDLLNFHPLFGAIPRSIRAPLEGSTKETMKLRGVTLYKEGSKPNGIWLISNGVVKWTSKSIKNKYSLHPTFTHGSTLGLYEVLSGKPKICDMITDSVVLCFFIESEKILSVLRSDSSVEDFLWQESAIVLVKVLLPQIFEKMEMQDLRAFVAERSIMKAYLRGETIDIPHLSIGFLLEGFVKTQGVEELITSPAALLPAHGSLSFQNLETSGASFSRQGSSYQVDTRARVIIFDMSALEADNALQQRSSLVPQLADHSHRPLSRELGLMSWPENLYKRMRHKQNPDGIDRQANSLSAKATQLSIVGSMVDIRGRTRSLPGNSLMMSSPTVTSYHGQRLVSVQSEGSATMRKNLEVRKTTRNITPTQLQIKYPRESCVVDDPSDESGAEDEIIVRIDSPSGLSFRQSS